MEPVKEAAPPEEDLVGEGSRAVTLEDKGPVRRMRRTASLRSGRIHTGDEFLGCMRRNLCGQAVAVVFVCALYLLTFRKV